MATDPLRAAGLRTFNLQMRRSSPAASAIVTLYMVATAWAFTPWRIIALWVGLQLANQIGRTALLAVPIAREQDDRSLRDWARLYTLHMAVTGAVWGSTAFLFLHPAQPITVALTLCNIYAITAGSVPGQAYHPPAFYALATPIFAAVLWRLVATGDVTYAMLGLGSAGFAAIMVGFCRVQAGVLREGFRIRFENQALVAALTGQKAEAEAARHDAELASLAKSQFLAAASHDLRQPLYALSLFSASLGTLRLDAQGKKVVDNIQDSIAVMESLFAGLLDLSKLEAGIVVAQSLPVSVDLLFDRLSQYSLPIALERGLDLRFRSDGEWVTSDPLLLEQVLSNLIANALRYTERGGVLVAARRRGGAVALEVWDTGPGIDEADRERIFQEFVQLGNRERDRHKGLGLGLSIVRRSAALLGATVSLASRPGRGSRFALSQPLAAPPLTMGVVAGSAAAIGPLPRDPALPLLLVDDDPAVRAALEGLLGRWGARVRAVAGAEEALALIDGGMRFGVVLCDYRLGGDGDGLALLRTIAERHAPPTPPFALVTGDVGPALLAAAHAAAVPLLHKPVRPDDLRALLGLPVDAIVDA